MRKHHVIAVLAVLLIGVVAKQFFFPPRAAEADPHSATLDIRQMQLDRPKSSGAEDADMTFVFDSE